MKKLILATALSVFAAPVFAVTTMEDCEREREMAYGAMFDRVSGMGILELFEKYDTSNAYYRRMVSKTLRSPPYDTEEWQKKRAKQYAKKYFDRCVIDIGH